MLFAWSKLWRNSKPKSVSYRRAIGRLGTDVYKTLPRSDANRSKRSSRDHVPSFYVRSVLHGRNAAHSLKCIENNFRKRHVDRICQFGSDYRQDLFVKKTQVWIEFVIGRIFGSSTNDLIQLLQFCVQRELHEQRFNEFIRVINPKSFDSD